jgi:mono/diheme cytochrome c family protein
MKIIILLCCLALPLISASAFGADAAAGRRLAQMRCSPCHIVAPNQRQEVADAPPFEAIGRKFGFNSDILVLNLMGPHAKMNFSLRRPDAEDIAAYVGTLAR